ncbi:MAG: polyhydroxybutyrate depolymerase [Solirubrobacteraceae bacterium]|nr:polyhydroxybutyrate depolymerase [Solirubrobacteraceae bacterium]
MRSRNPGHPTARILALAAAAALLGGSPARADAPPPPGGLIPGLLSGLSGGGGQPQAPAPGAETPPPSGACAAGPPVPGDRTITLSSAGLTRTAVLHLPPAAAGTPLALIVAFHGFDSDAAHFARDSGLSTLGDQQHYAVVYPGTLGTRWAISGRERDVIFASDLLDRVESLACIDTRRIYATGVSMGAGMAARVGCELSSRIAALVLVAGGYRSLPPCRADRPLSVLEIHGTSDTSVPYHGQGQGYDGAVLPYISGWAARDHCGPTPTKRLVAAHTVLYRWSGCASGALVEHLRIYGSGHGLPNAPGSEISSGNRSPISGVRNIWHFLASRTLSRPFADSDG